MTSAFLTEHANIVSLQLLEIYLSDQIKQTLILTEHMNLDIQIARNNQMAASNILNAEKSKALITANNLIQNADMLNYKYSSVLFSLCNEYFRFVKRKLKKQKI